MNVAAAHPAVELPGEATVERLANGLTVCLLSNRVAPVVTTALWYRAGTRDEAPGEGGVAHFLEHMMFKGSRRYGPGDVDRRTQRLGGDNNAFTSHDATCYHFRFAPDRWRQALAIEADRMAGLTLDRREVDSERRVILEEVAMYDADPWDSLDQKVHAARFPGHPYGRPVLGTAETLRATGRDALARFHHRFYRPGNAVLVVAGDVGREAFEAVEEAFGGIEDREGEPGPGMAPGLAPGGSSVRQRKGEVPRLMVSLPAPAGGHPDAGVLRLATTLLASGRASRLHRRLVDDEQLCAWVQADLGETLDPGSLVIAAELVPEAEPERVEAAVLAEVAALGRRPPAGDELERARRVALADWTFGHEKVYQQALVAGGALCLFGDLGLQSRQLAAALAAGADDLAAAVRRHLDAEAAVVGWSLPANGEAGSAP